MFIHALFIKMLLKLLIYTYFFYYLKHKNTILCLIYAYVFNYNIFNFMIDNNVNINNLIWIGTYKLLIIIMILGKVTILYLFDNV